MQIPGYENLEQIGAGALGLVYKARQVSLGRLVAIKVLRPELRDDPVSVAQFRLEANAVAHLKHSNILWVHEAGEVEGLPFFVMEYVSAYSVGQWIQRKGRISEADVLTVADSIARALKYAWDRAGLIHCDIKPDNILIDEDGIVKVADFSGLSRDNLLPESELIRHFTIGTPNYMSPEQVNGLLDLDCRADMYALGALLYHMTTGVMPFAGMSQEEVMRGQVAGYLADPLETCPELSLPVITLIEKLLIKDRNARGPDWKVVIDDIAQVRAGLLPHPPLPLPGASTLRRSIPQVFQTADMAGHIPPIKRTRKQIRLPEKTSLPVFGRPPARKLHLGWLIAIASGLLFLDLYLLRNHLFKRRPVPPVLMPISVPSQRPIPPQVSNETASRPILPVENPPRPQSVHAPERPPSSSEPPKPSETNTTPEVAPPASTVSEPSLVESAPPVVAEPQPEQYIATVNILARSALLTQRRNFDQAIRGLEQWLATQSPHHFLQLVEIEIRGLKRIKESLARLCRSGGRAAGITIDGTPGITGEVIRLSEGNVVTVRHRLGEGTVTMDFDLMRLSDTDLERLFLTANGEVGPRDAAAWAIGQGQWRRATELLSRATGDDADFLRQWLEARQDTQREAAALRAFDDARTLVQASRFRDAQIILRRTRETTPKSQIISWVFRQEWAELERLIEEEIANTPSSPSPSPPPSVTPPPPADPTRDQVSEGDTVFIRDLRQRPSTFDGKTIRLRFRNRGGIEAIDGGRFTTTLFSEDGEIRVEFPEEGWRWVNNLPEYFDRGTTRYVYGVFDANREVLQLIGRTRKVPLGGRSVEYGW